MKKNKILDVKKLIYILFVTLSLALFGSCSNQDSAEKVHIRNTVDALNELAYKYRYMSIEQSCLMADSALSLSADYPDGEMEAVCNIGYAMVQSMRYDSAMVCFNNVINNSRNGLMVLVADVGMMRVCKLLAMNREFCVYRNDVLKHIKTIGQVEGDMNEHQLKLWNVSLANYHCVEAEYLTFMKQSKEAEEHLKFFDDNQEIVVHDSVVLADNYLMRFVTSLEKKDITLDELEYYLTNMLFVSSQRGYKYFEGIALNGLSQLLRRDTNVKETRLNYLRSYMGGDEVKVEDLPRLLVERSLMLHEEYGNKLQESYALITMSDMLMAKGENEGAVSLLFHDLQNINRHHALVNPDDTTALFVFQDDSVYMQAENPNYVSTEMEWIQNPEIIAVPAWMSSVREQLSKVYEAMGYDEAARYYHAMYKKIQSATRQDMMQEQRKEQLEDEAVKLNALIAVLIFSVIVMLWFTVSFTINSQKKKKVKVQRLSRVMDICKKMTNAIPQEIDDEGDVSTAVHEAVDGDIRELSPTDYEQNVLDVFFDWIEHNGKKYLEFTEETRRIESETYNSERRMEENKRQHVDKSTCISIVQGITPFLDRAIREVNKLAESKADVTQEEVQRRLEYVGELIDKINEYNEVLGHWVKVRQGAVNLNIESFELKPLFDTLVKGRKTFESKNIELAIEQKYAVVKADKALTLFMMNTLLDNARKYTPEGGKVSLTTDVLEDYVEVSIQDSGRGLSDADLDKINNMKVYDSTQIGVKEDEDGQIRANKGFGFGLQNCRGIIEKYKKLGAKYSMCAFGVESTLGEGSRFYFRLPRGVIKAFTLLIMLFAMNANAQDSLTIDKIYETEQICNQLEKSNTEKKLILLISVMVLVVSIIVFVLLYYKHILLGTFNMRQLLQFNGRMFAAQEEELPRILYEGVSDIRLSDCVAVAIPDEDNKELKYFHHGKKAPDELLKALMHSTYDDGKALQNVNEHIMTFPLTVNIENENIKIGVMGIMIHDSYITKGERIILELIAQFTAIHIYFSSTKVENQQTELELLEDQQRRTELEEQRIHVENMVLDNCLSTIKHETMYYPSRIRQILDADHIDDIHELINYYRDVFTLLGQNASKQLQKSVLKLSSVSCDELKSYAEKSFSKQNKRLQLPVTISVSGDSGLHVRGDKILLKYMIDSLISVAFEEKVAGELHFSFVMSEGFVKFALSDSRKHFTKDQQAQLFYADSIRMDVMENVLHGSQYLVAKQIIREHDDRLGHPGCRIYAEESGVVFTLPYSG